MGFLLANRRARPRCRSMPLRPGSLVPEGAGFPKMAADVSVTHRPPLSPEAGAEVEADDAAERRAPEEELPPLDPEEIRKRLEHTERQFRNRRKILIRGLPGDVTNQVWGGGSVAGNTTLRVRGGNRATPTLACAWGRRRESPSAGSVRDREKPRAGCGEGVGNDGGRNQFWTEGGRC